jgi:glycosyltransferase involved in cell wall biosynthesis
LQHVFVSSIPWFSAAAEYALQLALYMRQQGYNVAFVVHQGSGLGGRAREAGFPTAELALRPKGLIASVFGALRVMGLATGWFRQLAPSVDQEQMVWVLAGHEHSAACAGLLVRRFFASVLLRRAGRSGRQISVVRLRCQDQFRLKPTLWNRVLDRLTAIYVVPSHLAARRMRSAHPRARLYVQPFCKDFALRGTLDGSTSAHRLFVEAFIPGVDAIPTGPDSLVLVCVARFDPVKGLHELMRAFAGADLGYGSRRIASLVVIGRTENVRADDLAQAARELLGWGRSEGSRHFAMNSEGSRRVYILDERVPGLERFLAGCTAAVISSLGSEIVCRTAVEFLQVGLPVVATPVGSLMEALPGAAALFAEEASEPGLRRAIERLAAEHEIGGLARRREAAAEHGQGYGLVGYQPLLDQLVPASVLGHSKLLP